MSGLMSFLNGGVSASAISPAMIAEAKRLQLEEARKAAVQGGPDPSMFATQDYAKPAASTKAKGLAGIDPQTWLAIASSFASGAQGGGWAAALKGTNDAFTGKKAREEDDTRTDAQKRAMVAMQMGDMPGALRILSEAKGLQGDALNMQAGLEQEARGQKREDRIYERGRTDSATDHARDRGEQLSDIGGERTYKTGERQAGEVHDVDMLGRKIQGEKEIEGIKYKSALALKPSQVFTDENQLRTQYLGQNKTFSDVRDAYSRIKTIEGYVADNAKPSPASDISLIFNYMKMNDPGSTVREGEYATAQNAGSVPTQLRNIYNKVMDGTTLSPEQRKDFLGAANSLYEAQEKSFSQSYDFYRGEAHRNGFDPNAIQDLRLKPDAPASPDAPGAPVARPADAPAALWPMMSDDERQHWNLLSPRGKELLIKKHQQGFDGLQSAEDMKG